MVNCSRTRSGRIYSVHVTRDSPNTSKRLKFASSRTQRIDRLVPVQRWPSVQSLTLSRIHGRFPISFHPNHDRFYCRHLASLREREYSIGEYDKIFTSQWITQDQVLLGTKCNHLLLLHLQSGICDDIPTVDPIANEHPRIDMHCGIHSMAKNPSETLLATGGKSPNDLVVYRTPSLEPTSISRNGHTDWVFDVCWLDDQIVASGGRDGKLAVWKVDDDYNKVVNNLSVIEPLESRINWYIENMFAGDQHDRDKVRALAFNKQQKQLAALNLSSMVKLYDMTKFQEVTKLETGKQENVCLSHSPLMKIYAIGTRSDVLLLDETLKLVDTIRMPTQHCGVRSLSFTDDILTIGTGSQDLHFFSIRKNQFLLLNRNGKNHIKLGKGWFKRDEMYEMLITAALLPSIDQAVFTHSYDKSGKRLFTAGGPLPASIAGNYLALWQ